MIKKIIFVFLIIIIGIFFYFGKNSFFPSSSETISPISEKVFASPTPSPSPIITINEESNLSKEAENLKVPEFTMDYKALETSLENF